MSFIIGVLTFFMLVDTLVLVLLVLMQLPKKDAGAGVAFGGGAADALFGAGQGSVLTKATKYAAGIFLVMAVVLSIMQSHFFRGSTFQRDLERLQNETTATAPAVLPGPVEPSSPGAAPSTPSTPADAAAIPPSIPLQSSGSEPAPGAPPAPAPTP